MNIGAETEQVEFKKSTGELKEGIISLASMLNKHGACDLYFGVKNNGDVIGQEIGESTLRDVSRDIASFIHPQIIPEIGAELLGEKTIIHVRANGGERPYSAYGRYYIRVADEDKQMQPAQLRQFMLNSPHYLTSLEAPDQQLTFRELRLLYETGGLTLRADTFEKNLHLLTENGKYNILAYLLADNNSFSIKTAVFEGTDKLHLKQRNEFGFRCLLTSMQQVLNAVSALNETDVEISGARRNEKSKIDIACFREAWINACLHSRWERMTPPSVYVFSDRIEVTSVGGLPEGLTEEEFFAGQSRPVNLELMQVMVQLGFVEQTGHGVPLIISRYGREAFFISENFITVTFPFCRREAAAMQAQLAEEKHGSRGNIIDERRKQELHLMQETPTISIAAMGKVIGVSTASVMNDINALKKEGLLQREGARKNGKWVVKK